MCPLEFRSYIYTSLTLPLLTGIYVFYLRKASHCICSMEFMYPIYTRPHIACVHWNLCILNTQGLTLHVSTGIQVLYLHKPHIAFAHWNLCLLSTQGLTLHMLNGIHVSNIHKASHCMCPLEFMYPKYTRPHIAFAHWNSCFLSGLLAC